MRGWPLVAIPDFGWSSKVKVTIYRRIAAPRLHHVVPPAYREEAVAAAGELAGELSVLLFAHAPRDVVPSAPVRRALRRLGEPAPGGIVAVGTVFTEEAHALLAGVGARVMALRKTHWTDDSARARQL